MKKMVSSSFPQSTQTKEDGENETISWRAWCQKSFGFEVNQSDSAEFLIRKNNADTDDDTDDDDTDDGNYDDDDFATRHKTFLPICRISSILLPHC